MSLSNLLGSTVALAAHPHTSTFTDLGVADDFVAILNEQGITAPFPIQHLALSDGFAGRDICGQAKTGSGKTLAFGLPLIERLHTAQPKQPVALVLVPTRELCVQVAETLQPFAERRGFTVTAVYGGAPMGRQINALARGTEVVVATPGRLIDLAERRTVSLRAIETVVIDEADEMADLGFLPQVHHLLRQLEVDHHTMLFSATLDGRVSQLVDLYMNDVVTHRVESETRTVDTSRHLFLQVHHMDKAKVAARIAGSNGRVLVFVATKRACDRTAKDLAALGVPALPIHGDLPQRKRELALGRFTDGSSPVLVATNVAARGLDVDGVDVVIHYDPPENSRTYLHRSGRTARAGEAGLVITFVEWDQLKAVRTIQNESGLLEPIVKMFSNDDRLDDLASWEPPAELAPAPPKRIVRRSSRRRRSLL
ncbi:MAG: DEAD/DEAH box helicase [Acidimicrobiia bacterium]